MNWQGDFAKREKVLTSHFASDVYETYTHIHFATVTCRHVV